MRSNFTRCGRNEQKSEHRPVIGFRSFMKSLIFIDLKNYLKVGGKIPYVPFRVELPISSLHMKA